MPYKGLGLFLDAVDLLCADNIAVEIGVFGEGALGTEAKRLESMGAEVGNHWLCEGEIAAVLARFHVVVLSYTEASQSGVAAMAFGAGLPVVATPVGGLKEQIRDGEIGVLARSMDAESLAEAIKSLLLVPGRYEAISRTIANTREQRSMARFVER